MVSSDIYRGCNDTIILSLLIGGDSYGYEISKRIREITEERYVMKETTLYSAFSRLEKSDYISSYMGEETFGKKRIYYRITDSGREYYREKCREWKLTTDVVGKFIMEAGKNGNN